MRARRRITFAQSAVEIEYEGERAARVVDFLFRAVSADETIAPHRTYRLGPGEPPEELVLERDGVRLLAHASGAEMAEFLLGDVSYHLVDRSAGGVVLHAAALAHRGAGVLVAGGIGAGKTTLAAWLTAQGLDYMTDEMVYIPEGIATLHPFLRPLNLKKPSRPALASVLDFAAHAGEFLSTEYADLIPAALLGAANVQSTPGLRWMLFPHYRPEGQGLIARLTPAQAGLALIKTLVNARNLPGQGFAQVADLARQVPAFDLQYGHFDQIRDVLQIMIPCT